ncbi:MAG: hypothetical protein CMC55_06105 [Flavobacteriaceae bacterium]|nr:hypothetical protein [Flavobacteriaceae bacterium]
MNGYFNWGQGMTDYLSTTGTGVGSTPNAAAGFQAPMGNVGGWNTFSNILGGIGSIANAYTGFKQLGLARDQFNWQRDAYNTNLVNQANLVNSQLADRQRRRQFFDSSAATPEAYLAQYGAASSTQEANDRQKQNQNSWTRSTALNSVGTRG